MAASFAIVVLFVLEISRFYATGNDPCAQTAWRLWSHDDQANRWFFVGLL